MNSRRKNRSHSYSTGSDSSRERKSRRHVKSTRKYSRRTKRHTKSIERHSRSRGKREGNAFRYTGGKAAIAADIHEEICKWEDKLVGQSQDYLEPFAGAMSVALKFALDNDDGYSDRKIIVCDANPDMTKLWSSLKQGSKPPKYVSEREYERYKNGKSHMKGYVGSVFAFGGAMFGAYRGRYQSETKTRKEGEGSYNKLMKIVPLLDHITVKSARSYDEFSPKNMTIYCDPPYETESEKSNPNEFLRDFDHEHFWDTMRQWSKNNLVFISEVSNNIPSDFKIVWKKVIKRSFRTSSRSKNKTEVLAIHKSWFDRI